MDGNGGAPGSTGSAMDSFGGPMTMDSLEPLGESGGVAIVQKLTQIKHSTMETADIIRRMEQEQEAFAIKCHERQKLEGEFRFFGGKSAKIWENWAFFMFRVIWGLNNEKLETIAGKYFFG